MQLIDCFTGEQEWKTSKNDFSDSECPNLNHGDKGSLQNCKAFCLEEPGCNAFNYDSSSTHCVLRGCELPVVPPTKDVSGTYDGYWTEGKNNLVPLEMVPKKKVTKEKNSKKSEIKKTQLKNQTFACLPGNVTFGMLDTGMQSKDPPT